jgi:hypothetical protein
MLCHRSILCCVAHLMEANSNEMLLVPVCVLTAGAMHAAAPVSQQPGAFLCLFLFLFRIDAGSPI